MSKRTVLNLPQLARRERLIIAAVIEATGGLAATAPPRNAAPAPLRRPIVETPVPVRRPPDPPR